MENVGGSDGRDGGGNTVVAVVVMVMVGGKSGLSGRREGVDGGACTRTLETLARWG